MNLITLERLEWNALLSILEGFTHTPDGKQFIRDLLPTYSKEEIEERWDEVMPLISLLLLGYTPPVSDIQPIHTLTQGLLIGQILEGEDLLTIRDLAHNVSSLQSFASEHEGRCKTMASIRSRLFSLRDVERWITQTVDDNGQLRDDASPELKNLREQIRLVKKRLETTLQRITKEEDIAPYIQDDFFTVRHDRYVIPIRLDGRGRVKGSIISVSGSGQTLFIEPETIRQTNEQLRDLEVAEKIESIRILKVLSQKIAGQIPELNANYKVLIELDILVAEAQLAVALDGQPLLILDHPALELKRAAHPLLKFKNKKTCKTNTIELHEGQHVLVVSGPNAGGKTVILKTVGLIHLMVGARLLPPVGEGSSLFLFHNIYVELGDSQDIARQLSTFSGHLTGLKPILEKAQSTDLALLDELCVGTEPHLGAALAQAMIEFLAQKHTWVLTTTHYDNVKLFAMNQPYCRSAAMGFHDHSPTYTLSFDLPGLSYGLEVAEKVGIVSSVVRRARDLHGTHLSSFDEAIARLNEQSEKLKATESELRHIKRDAESEKLRWSQEAQTLKQQRGRLAESALQAYDMRIQKLFSELEDELKRIKNIRPTEISTVQKSTEKLRENISDEMRQLAHDQIPKSPPPGKKASFSHLKIGDRVHVIKLKKSGVIQSLGRSPTDKFEVTVGHLSVKVRLDEIRALDATPRQASPTKLYPSVKKELEGVFVPTSSNQLDMRGMRVDEGLKAMWSFIDAGILRGETSLSLIHGHGTAQLKSAVRLALSEDPPYSLRFRPGEMHEGGDGVTVIFL